MYGYTKEPTDILGCIQLSKVFGNRKLKFLGYRMV